MDHHLPVRAVLWDADGVLQQTPARSWDLAVRVVSEFPDVLTGAPIDDEAIRAAADRIGLGDELDAIVAVWSTFDLLGPSLEVVEQVRAAGTPCYLATNQDLYRAARMRERTPYSDLLDGAYYSCDLGAAKLSAAFFEHIAADLALTPGEMCFVDDRPDNVASARAVGLQAEQWTHHEGVDRLRDLLGAHGVGLDDLRRRTS